MANNTGFLLNGELCLGGGLFFRVQTVEFGKHRWVWVGEDVVEDVVTRLCSFWPVRVNYIREFT